MRGLQEIRSMNDATQIQDAVEPMLLPKSTLEIVDQFTGGEDSDRVEVIDMLVRAGANSFATKLRFFCS